MVGIGYLAPTVVLTPPLKLLHLRNRVRFECVLQAVLKAAPIPILGWLGTVLGTPLVAPRGLRLRTHPPFNPNLVPWIRVSPTF